MIHEEDTRFSPPMVGSEKLAHNNEVELKVPQLYSEGGKGSAPLSNPPSELLNLHKPENDSEDYMTAEDILANTNQHKKIKHISEVLSSPEKEEAVFEKIHGPDDRVQVLQTDFPPAMQTCYLQIISATGRVSYATGWMAGPRLCMTAGHVVYDNPFGWAQYIRVIPGTINGWTQPYGSEIASQFVAPSQYVDNWNTNYDYGGIVLPTTQLSGRVGYLSYGTASHSQTVNNFSMTMGYPADKPAGTLWSNGGHMLSPTSTHLKYYFDTYGGQSGSPVFFPGGFTNPKVVGIHTTGLTPNRGIRIKSSVFSQINYWKTL